MTKKIFVLDTSVFLTDFRSIFSYKTNDICVPLIVLEEIDKNKKRLDAAGMNGRLVIRIIDQLRSKGSLYDGIRIRKGGGKIYAASFELGSLPPSYSIEKPDNQIIATAITEQRKNPDKKVIVVSCDINLRIKCDSLKIPVEDYIQNQIVKERSELYTGYETVEVDDSLIDDFYSGKEIIVGNQLEFKNLYPNQFLTLISNKNDKKSALARFLGQNLPLKKILFSKNNASVFGISPKNREQTFAMELLMDENVPIVSLIGRAGSGKTMLSVAAGLQQVIGGKESKYNRLIISRPIQPLGKDIGYLPGTLEEKMIPWLVPIQDNLRFLLGNDNVMLEEYIDKKIIEIEALTYIRGRSIQNSIIIIDETQNLNRHEMKTILTRVGNDSKIILTGDIEQIDNVNLNEVTNGLSNVVEKFKPFDLAGHVTLVTGERSAVASLAAKIL